MTDVATGPSGDPAARRATASAELELGMGGFRTELTGYCYRMLGGAFEAEDAAQVALVRAWQNIDRFEGRASLRSWLYRIATNVCFDMLGASQRRARPMDLSPAHHATDHLAPGLVESTWLEPMPDGRVLRGSDDPAETTVARESVRLAFVAALQYLPPRQRAVLILREVLRWKADEVAQLLETSVASVNSALQRARATLDAAGVAETDTFDEMDGAQRELLDRYVDAFERYDIDSLTELIYEDATMSMPPYELWLRGHADIRAWLLGPGAECRGSRLLPTNANGSPAFGQYRLAPEGDHAPWALVVLEVSGGKIVGLNSFLDVAHLFPLFGLPPRVD
ncbi:MAG: sig7 [Ilumatobacteraceae bacterium]|nr:sig7 [Ilumatobacteraceae bacterium]